MAGNWIDLIGTISDTAKALDLWKLLLKYIGRKKQILVLGASGTGKTQFVHSLSDPANPLQTAKTEIHDTTGATGNPRYPANGFGVAS